MAMDSTAPELVEVLPQHRIDAAAVAAWLRGRLPPAYDSQPAIRQFQGHCGFARGGRACE